MKDLNLIGKKICMWCNEVEPTDNHNISCPETFKPKKYNYGWIKVSDRLPEKGLRVLFVCNDLDKVLMGHHIGNALMQFSPLINGMITNNNSPIITDMTHWMSLPEPPK